MTTTNVQKKKKITALENLENLVVKIDNMLSRHKMVSEFLDTLKEKTGVKRSYFIMAVLGIVIGTVVGALLVNSVELLCDAIIVLFPIYGSVKAIETADSSDDDTKWLTYWIVYSAFCKYTHISESYTCINTGICTYICICLNCFS
jgi:receptor expression-enhancing protein 5/6